MDKHYCIISLMYETYFSSCGATGGDRRREGVVGLPQGGWEAGGVGGEGVI